MALAMLAPSISNAEVGARDKMMAPRPSSSMPARPAFSCDKIDTMAAGFKTHMVERADSFGTKKEDVKTKFEAEKGKRMGQLSTKRTDMDGKRQEAYTALRAKATTSAQKAAVETFVATVDDLVEKRRVAVDAAITSFENEVALLGTEVQSTMSSLRTSFSTDIDALFANAKATCTAGGGAAEVQAVIKDGIADMKAKRTSGRTDTDFRTKLDVLRKTREAAVKVAVDDFTAGMTKAKADLKAALQ